MWLLTFSKVLGPDARCGRRDLGFSMRPGCLLLVAIEGNENELAGGADTGYEESLTSVEAGRSEIDNDVIEGFRSGVWISFGVSGERLRSRVQISFGVSGGDGASDSGVWVSSSVLR